MTSKSTKYRQKIKENDPVKYKTYIDKQKARNKKIEMICKRNLRKDTQMKMHWLKKKKSLHCIEKDKKIQ